MIVKNYRMIKENFVFYSFLYLHEECCEKVVCLCSSISKHSVTMSGFLQILCPCLWEWNRDEREVMKHYAGSLVKTTRNE